MTRSRRPAGYSKISVKSQTVLPKQVREALGISPGDTLRYRITDEGVLIDRAPRITESDDPFATFGEWAGPADSDAYDGL